MVKLKRGISFVLAVIMVFGLTLSAAAYNDNYPNTHRNTGQNIADLIAVAKTQLGYKELNPKTGYPIEPNGSAGYTKYGESFGNPTGEWCAYFVSWCARNAGISTSVVPRLGSCSATVEWYKKHSVFYSGSSGYVPKAGDIIFFNWSGGASAKHIGIVTGVSGNNVYTIEGNTGSDRGYMCCGRTRSRTAGYIVGYGVPAYNDAKTYAGSHSFSGANSGGGSHSDSIKYSTSKLSVITTSATEISATSATLHGAVSNGGRLFVSTAGFFFGTDKLQLAKYPVLTALSKPEFDMEMDVASKVGELTPNTTYYYRTYACIDGRDYLGPMYAVVTVNDIPQQLLIQSTNLHVGVGQTAEIIWAQLPVGSTDKGVTWTSADEKIATVTGEGVVKGVGFGNVTIKGTTNYGSASAECTVDVLIPTPANLSLQNKSEKNITISWDAVANAKGYVIYRNTDMDSEPVKFAQLDASVTKYEDTSVVPGERYYYRIMTVAPEEKYNSDISSVVYSTAKLSTPQGVTSARDGLWIDVTWKEVEGATGYLVYRSATPDGLYTNIGKAYTNKYVDHTVQSAQLYYYKVVADNGNERTHSDFSAVTSTRAKFVSSTVQSENKILSSMQAVPVEDREVRIVRSRTDIPVLSF